MPFAAVRLTDCHAKPTLVAASGPARLKEANMKDKQAFDNGLKTRREVLGAEYVDAAIRNADDFNRPMQELVTEYCWDGIWNRPGLDRRTRSMLNLAMITALNRPHELKLHVRGAINNGLSKGDIQEVFLQAAIYCGVPAAIDSFRAAKEVFKETGI
jgi:4-carboxymuconolactone decarboxylase